MLTGTDLLRAPTPKNPSASAEAKAEETLPEGAASPFFGPLRTSEFVHRLEGTLVYGTATPFYEMVLLLRTVSQALGTKIVLKIFLL
jgi:hypothetical protein